MPEHFWRALRAKRQNGATLSSVFLRTMAPLETYGWEKAERWPVLPQARYWLNRVPCPSAGSKNFLRLRPGKDVNFSTHPSLAASRKPHPANYVSWLVDLKKLLRSRNLCFPCWETTLSI